MKVKALKPILNGVHEIAVGGIGDVPDKYADALIAIGAAEKVEEPEKKAPAKKK